MPEGPEVETIRRGLDASIVGQTIDAVQVLWAKSFAAPVEQVDQLVVGARVVRVARRAKVLIIELDDDHSLLVHLKMTGQMVLVMRDGERYAGGHPSESMRTPLPDASTKVVFEFASGDQLFFNDQRKFGWIKLLPTAEVELDPLVARLGPEVLSAGFTRAYLAGQLQRRRPGLAIFMQMNRCIWPRFTPADCVGCCRKLR
jgi:formamidopyrimidine-DNA glycosylase